MANWNGAFNSKFIHYAYNQRQFLGCKKFGEMIMYFSISLQTRIAYLFIEITSTTIVLPDRRQLMR